MSVPYKPWICPGRTPYLESTFWTLSPEEADAFCKEFISRIPERVEQLELAIRSHPDFSQWRATFERESLKDIGPWLLASTQRRPLRDDESVFQSLTAPLTSEEKSDLADYMRPRTHVFTDESWSKLVDAATYFGECVRKTNERWSWKWIKQKSAMTRGQPALILDSSWGSSVEPFGLGRNVTLMMLEYGWGPDRWQVLFDNKVDMPSLIPKPERKRRKR